MRSKIGRVVVLALISSSLLVAGGAHARGRSHVFYDCRSQGMGIQTTREQARTYLPEGFEPSGGAGDQDAIVHLYVTTQVCGDALAPELELAATFLAVRPPEEYRAKSGSHLFLLDAVISGPRAARLRRDLCAGGILAGGAVNSSQQMNPTDGSVSRGSSQVESESLSFELDVATSGAAGSYGGGARWLYEDGGRIKYFESSITLRYISFGTGHVQFTQPYLGLPPAAPGPSYYDLQDVGYLPSKACRG